MFESPKVRQREVLPSLCFMIKWHPFPGSLKVEICKLTITLAHRWKPARSRRAWRWLITLHKLKPIPNSVTSYWPDQQADLTQPCFQLSRNHELQAKHSRVKASFWWISGPFSQEFLTKNYIWSSQYEHSNFEMSRFVSMAVSTGINSPRPWPFHMSSQVDRI